jgi:hypothetical protein
MLQNNHPQMAVPGQSEFSFSLAAYAADVDGPLRLI